MNDDKVTTFACLMCGCPMRDSGKQWKCGCGFFYKPLIPGTIPKKYQKQVAAQKPNRVTRPANMPPQSPRPLLRPAEAIKTRLPANRRRKKAISYEPLKAEFGHDGFRYRQIAREGDYAIYEQAWTGRPNPSVCYEVVVIRYRDAKTQTMPDGNDVHFPAREVYPSSEDWGTYGWTVLTRDAAFDKLAALRRQP